MKYLSLFSGIEAASVAWQPLGWEPVAFVEVEPFPCAVLAHHYPDVPNLGDITTITDEQTAALGPIDIVVGGSPCQNFSVAGNRQGLAGKQSGLFHEFVRICHAARTDCGTRWLVWENVPGVLSSHQGRDFAQVVNALAGCNLTVPDEGWKTEGVALGEYGLLEWAVLDAQWFGLAQRRKRLFAVLDTGRWADRPPILLERDRLRGDCPARGKPQRGDTTTRLARADEHGGFIPNTAMCLNAKSTMRHDATVETFIVHGTQDPIASTTTAHALGTNHGQENVVCAFQERGRTGGKSLDIGGDIAYALTAPSNGGRTQERNIQVGTSVRRLTPRECERLQGFNPVITQIRFNICLDHPNSSALVAIQCHKWQSSVWPVAEDVSMRSASIAQSHSNTNRDSHAPLAVFRVRMHSAPELVEIRHRGKLIWSASNVDAPKKSFQHMPTASFVQKIAGLLQAEVSKTQIGRAVSLPSVRLSFQAGNGNAFAPMFTNAITVDADFAERNPRNTKSITSNPGQFIPNPDSTLATLCCSVMNVISGFIPDEILLDDFSFDIEISSPYTEIPWRGKPAEQCPDGPRYKALGNSMAVPVMRWIGQQIDKAAGANTEDTFPMEKAA